MDNSMDDEGDGATEDDGNNGDGATDDDVKEDGNGDGAMDDDGNGNWATDNNDDDDDDGDDSNGAAAEDNVVDDDNYDVNDFNKDTCRHASARGRMVVTRRR